jgi:hypothetical protein
MMGPGFQGGPFARGERERHDAAHYHGTWEPRLRGDRAEKPAPPEPLILRYAMAA